MPIDDAIDGEVFGDDDDGGRGALNWGTCKGLTLRVHAPLFICQIPPHFAKIYIFNTGSAPVWILCQIICNRLVARIAPQPRYSVNFNPCPLG